MAKKQSELTVVRSPLDAMRTAIDGVDLPKSDLVIPPATKREPIDNWQVVVVGSIDVRQVSPQWLRLIEAIDESELEAGKKSLTALLTPAVNIRESKQAVQPSFVQFDVGAFAVTVVADRWIIQTVAEADRKRLVEVSALVFRKLNEISISAYGVNKNWTVKLKEKTAKQFLGEKLLKTDLALPKGNAEGQLAYKCRMEKFEINIQLSPSPIDDKWLTVNYNRHHQILDQKGYYDVGQMIIDDAEADWMGASEYATELLKSINLGDGE